MKKHGLRFRTFCVWTLFLVLLLNISGCSAGKPTGTYYPDSAEMQDNLQKKGYEVSVSELSGEQGTGEYLSAEKGTDFIRFYWLESTESVRHYVGVAQKENSGYDHLISMEADKTHGSMVLCATSAAIDDAGVRIVNINVKI